MTGMETVDTKTKRIIDALRKEGLTHEEHSAMKAHIFKYVASHPVNVSRADYIVEYISAFLDGARNILSFGNYSRVALACVLIIFIIGGGTAYASEASLPGDLLYAIKILVREPIEGALAISETSQADWKIELVSRRLTEAETLAARGAISVEESSIVQSRIQEYTESLDDAIATIAKKVDSEPMVAEIQSNFEGSLKVHEEALASLTAELPDMEQSLRPLLRSVRSRVHVATRERENAERRVAASSSEKIRSAALRKKDVAEARISQMRAGFTNAPIAADAPTERSVEVGTASLPESLENTIMDADASITTGAYGDAFIKLQGVVQAVQEVQLHMNVHKHILHEKKKR